MASYAMIVFSIRDAVFAVLDGVCQRALGNAAANAQMIELGGIRLQTGLDVTQVAGQLREGLCTGTDRGARK